MHHPTFFPIYLTALNADLGRWEFVKLGTPVSPHTVEAMNAILLRDGILAFIGTKEEFSSYLENLRIETEGASSRCLISLQQDTILGILGLYLLQDEVGRSELICYGSPLTWTLTVMMICESLRHQGCDREEFLSLLKSDSDELIVWPEPRYTIPSQGDIHGVPLFNHSRIFFTECDVQLAIGYLKGVA